MSKTNAAIAVLSTVLMCHGLVQASTLRELVDEQRGAMADEIAKKRSEARARTDSPTAVAAPTPSVTAQPAAESSKPRIEDASVVAVYGEVGKLTADVSVKGAVPAAVKEGYEVVPGWYVESITPQRVNFVRGKKRTSGAARHVVYLSEPATVATAQARGTATPSGFGSTLPPIPTPTQSPMAGMTPSQTGPTSMPGMPAMPGTTMKR